MATDRSRIPEPQPAKDFQFPPWKEFTLKNGMSVVLLQDNTFPQVSFRILIDSGASRDGGIRGINSMTAELLSRGTEELTASQLAEETEFMGGRLSSGSFWDSSWIAISSLSNYAGRALQILADSLIRPAFREDEIAFLVDQRRNNFLISLDSPSFLAGYGMSLALFPKHIYEFPVTGNRQSIDKINRHRVSDHYRNYFQATGSQLVAIGDFDAETVLPQIEKLFGDWKPHAYDPEPLPVLPILDKRKIWIIDKPDAVQSSIRVANHGVAKSNSDLPAILVMNTILGGFFGSRLNTNLRENKGFTYGVRSGFTERRFPGYFAVSTDVRGEVTGAAVREIIREMARLQREMVEPELLDLVKNYMVGRFPSDFETNDQLSQAIMEIKLYNLNSNYFTSLRKQISRITREQVMDVARKYLNPQKAAIVVAGNSELISRQLSEWGSVNIIDPHSW